ncbi:hypothetical protein NLX83_27825 [Allokutzneria sp. A3M-2-11 16]|uniref:hypothetical protein n=1 Tax=Allokutzneria sp. A3M-2-11 16 TaxID=2962043 RepID=UPI0020B65D53|nr:hypothetical protein [Allokutzneria sp. A3M-2-11 16]MCP3803091.1 hypothetical protein [Allokutzneria sp. A3M-2-11 16]
MLNCDWEREVDAFARDGERLMQRFFDQAEPGMEQRWRALLAKAEREPIPAGTARYDGMQLQRLGSVRAGKGPAHWATLAAAITAAERGDASGFATPGLEPYPGVMGDQVKGCLDFPGPPITGTCPAGLSGRAGSPRTPVGAGTWLDHGSTARVVAQVPGSRYITTLELPPENTRC